MKIAVCVPPPACDVYHHHSRYAEQIARVGATRDIPVELLLATSPDFVPRLFANLADERCIVHFHCFLYDFRAMAASTNHPPWHAIESARATTLATISDHPFTSFMQEIVGNAHPRTRFITIDDSFVDEMLFMNPALQTARFTHTPLGPPINYEPSHLTPFAERPYDLVLPIFLADMTGRSFASILAKSPSSWVTRAGAAAYETVLTDISRNPFHVLEECISRELGGGVRLQDIRAHRPDGVQTIVNLLNALDGLARQVRRHRMIEALLRSVGDLKVAIMSDPVPSLRVDPRVEFVGHQPMPKAGRLMANARAILNCSPTYPGNVHERVSVGMLYESCLITDVTPCMAAHFGPGEFIPYAPDSTMTIQDIFAAYDVAGIAAAGSAKVRANRGFFWEAHVDDLLEAARTPAAAAA